MEQGIEIGEELIALLNRCAIRAFIGFAERPRLLRDITLCVVIPTQRQECAKLGETDQ